ncbi:D-dopachrome decarboxylase-like [Branchiostoma floridae x Branchiostoma belcheri]
MPLCVLNTNLAGDAMVPDLEGKVASFLAEQLQKSPERVMVFVRAGQRATVGGTDRPFVLCEVSAVGSFAKEEHKKCHGEALKKFLSDNMNVREERVAVLLKNLDRSDVY